MRDVKINGRCLKFRVWDVVDKKFHYPEDKPRLFTIRLDGNIGDGDGCLYDEQHVPLQYIEEIDKNWNEIYEGDILTFETEYDYEFLYVVEFHNSSFNQPYIYRRMKGSDTVEVVGRSNDFEYHKYKIIGNIYENPLKIL